MNTLIPVIDLDGAPVADSRAIAAALGVTPPFLAPTNIVALPAA